MSDSNENILFENLNQLIDASCELFADEYAVGMALGEKTTYAEMHQNILKTAHYLLVKIGVQAGDKVAILAENSPGWCIAYFAILRIGAVAVPILPDFLDADVRHIMVDAQIKTIFVNKQQADKLSELSHEICKIFIDPGQGGEADESFYFEKILQGQLQNQEALGLFEDAVKSKDQPASIIYTSGTSGHSKAVVLSHANLCANAHAASQLLAVKRDWVFLSILPISHAYEFTIGFLLPLLGGAQIVYAGKPPTPAILEKICKKEKPSVMCIVPMVMEKIYKKRVLPMISSSPVLNFVKSVPLVNKVMWLLVGRKILEFFGGKLQVLAIGGAPICLETERFLRNSKLPYLVGYGLTETSPLLAGGPLGDKTITLGSAGKPIPGVEIKIRNPNLAEEVGEIMARGPNIMQKYLHNPELTAEVIDKDGWFATGDLGHFDAKGNLHITGRSKNVIVLAHGKNIYPEILEDKLNAFLHVVDSLVVLREKRLRAIVYLDCDLVDQQTVGMTEREREQHVKDILIDIKSKVNDSVPPFSKLNEIVELNEPFVKTATHKIKRFIYNM